LSLEEGEHLSQKSYNDWKIYLANISERGLSKQIEYKSVKGDTFKNKLRDIVAMFSITHHIIADKSHSK
jgi:hypothetical protein